MNYLYMAIAVIVALLVIKFILKLSVKIFTTIFVILAVVITVSVMVIQPKMHKTFDFSVIERMLKFNADGSTSIIETITSTQIQKENK